MPRIQPCPRVPIVRFPFPFPYPPVRRPGGPQPFRWAIALLLAAVLTAAPCPAQVATVSVCSAEEVSAPGAGLPLAEGALVEGAIPDPSEADADRQPPSTCEAGQEPAPVPHPVEPRVPATGREPGFPADDGFADVIADGGSPVSWHTIQYRLPPGETSRTWTLRVDLPEADLQAGRVFIRRHLATTDSLEAVREELTRTTYTLTLFLSRGYFATGKGNLHLQLEKGTPVPVERLPPPANLRLEEGGIHEPFLVAWDGEGDWLAAIVYKRALGTPIWERILGYSEVMPTIDPAPVTIGGHYLLVASQCGREARPSKPAWLAFRVEARSEWCQTCKGTGWLGQIPDGWPHPGNPDDGPTSVPPRQASRNADCGRFLEDGSQAGMAEASVADAPDATPDPAQAANFRIIRTSLREVGGGSPAGRAEVARTATPDGTSAPTAAAVPDKVREASGERPAGLTEGPAGSQNVDSFRPRPGPEVSRESGIGTTFAADEGDAGQARPAGQRRGGRRAIPLVLVGPGSTGSSPHPTPPAKPGKAPFARPRPDGEPYSELCPYCRGLGTRMYPYAVTEPLMPSMGN